MLKFDDIDCGSFFEDDNGEDLFERNPTVTFRITAPIYWWIDTDWVKYYMNMPLADFEFCFEDFPRAELIYLWYSDMDSLTPRQKMQALPLSTVVKATIQLTYRDIIEVCENYIAGEYKYTKGYGFPNEEEWKCFCETLLDIQGVRDLVKEDI